MFNLGLIVIKSQLIEMTQQQFIGQYLSSYNQEAQLILFKVYNTLCVLYLF